MSNEKRYVVTYETYLYARNDYMARRKAHQLNDTINKERDFQHSDVKDIVEQPFGKMGNRELGDISKPSDKSKDAPLPF
jgi:hypothetical protein